MAIHFSDIEIDKFRGINQLNVSSLNHINIILGDNNCGKTSFLEAMLLLRNPNEFANLLEIASLRRHLFEGNGESIFTSFLSLFPKKDSKKLEIAITALFKSNKIQYNLQGNINYNNRFSEDIAFEGIQTSINADNTHIQKNILYKMFDSLENVNLQDNKDINIVYLPSFSQLRCGAFTKIIRDKEYKKECINILQQFDSNIQDIILTKEEFEFFPTVTIVHSELGNMPLSTFGDGIKKVITIASKIVEAANGILLIDEIEMAIHAKYYETFFSFVVSACKQFNVQLFITANDMEAIEALLNIQNYNNNEEDVVSVITLKKDIESGRTLSRVLNGERVLRNRENFSFEVRL